jgi:hypothetical protein
MEIAMTARDHRSESARQRRRAVADVAPSYVILPAAVRSRIADAISSPDFVAVTLFSAIGLLTTLNVILRFADIGLM